MNCLALFPSSTSLYQDLLGLVVEQGGLSRVVNLLKERWGRFLISDKENTLPGSPGFPGSLSQRSPVYSLTMV